MTFNCENIGEFDTILDCRTPNEMANGTIQGATLIPIDQIQDRMLELNKDDTIAVYCRSGQRSGMVVNFLIQHGYNATNVGGINNFIGCIT